MSKRQLIDEIRSVNRTALPEFLSRFDEVDLHDYLQHLIRSQAPRMQGRSVREGRYVSAGTATTSVATRTAMAVAVVAPPPVAAATASGPTATPPRTPAWRDEAELPEPVAFGVEFASTNDNEWIDDLDAFSPTTVNNARTLATTTAQPAPDRATTDKWLF